MWSDFGAVWFAFYYAVWFADLFSDGRTFGATDIEAELLSVLTPHVPVSPGLADIRWWDELCTGGVGRGQSWVCEQRLSAVPERGGVCDKLRQQSCTVGVNQSEWCVCEAVLFTCGVLHRGLVPLCDERGCVKLRAARAGRFVVYRGVCFGGGEQRSMQLSWYRFFVVYTTFSDWCTSHWSTHRRAVD